MYGAQLKKASSFLLQLASFSRQAGCPHLTDFFLGDFSFGRSRAWVWSGVVLLSSEGRILVHWCWVEEGPFSVDITGREGGAGDGMPGPLTKRKGSHPKGGSFRKG